jgi:hypothetical protein
VYSLECPDSKGATVDHRRAGDRGLREQGGRLCGKALNTAKKGSRTPLSPLSVEGEASSPASLAASPAGAVGSTGSADVTGLALGPPAFVASLPHATPYATATRANAKRLTIGATWR